MFVNAGCRAESTATYLHAICARSNLRQSLGADNPGIPDLTVGANLARAELPVLSQEYPVGGFPGQVGPGVAEMRPGLSWHQPNESGGKQWRCRDAQGSMTS